jgi:hypothetical protein
MKHPFTGMKKWAVLSAAGTALLVIVALLGTVPTPNVQAHDDGMSMVIPRDTVAYGRTYSEWSAAWEQWADSIPTAHHPLFDNGDCSVAQSGPVWFLGGKFIPTYGSGSYTGVVRQCKVPVGKALYFPIFNGEDSVLEETGFPTHYTQIQELRASMAGWIDAANVLTLKVDGESIPNIKERFRVQSPAFVFTLPDDNFFNAVGEGPFNPGSYFPAVDDGYYVMLKPLSLGHHTIYFHGASPSFELEITYHIYVYR